MGFLNKMAAPLRKAFASEKGQQNAEIAKGAIYPPNLPGGLIASYGSDILSDYLRLDADLMARYDDYEAMDDYAELSSALNIYADDSVQIDTQTGKSMWVTSKDENVKIVLEDLFHKRLRIDEDGWDIARTMCKYGSDYEEVLVNETGVIGLNFLPPKTVRRIEGPHGDLHGFVQDFTGKIGYSVEEFDRILASRQGRGEQQGSALDSNVIALEHWEVAHFRFRGKHRNSPYGMGILDPARWIWKRLMLLEDAAVVFKVQRAPERYAFYVDVGDLPAAEALAFLNKVKASHKKRKVMSPGGQLNLRWESLSPEEDLYIPVRKGVDGARVEVLQSPVWQSTEDLNYFSDKMFSAINIPKAYLGQTEGATKASLSSLDVKFARTILRVQRELKNGFRQVARVHLAALGIDPWDVDYELHMTVPSSIFELAQLEVKNARAALAMAMKADVSSYWLLSKVYGLSDDEIQKIFIQRKEDFEREGAMMQGMQPGMGGPQQGGPPGAGTPSLAAPPMGNPGEVSGQQALQMAQQIPQQESRIWMPGHKSTPPPRSLFTEQELMRGNKAHEKRAEEQFRKLLKADQHTHLRLTELGQMLNELRQVSRRR